MRNDYVKIELLLCTYSNGAIAEYKNLGSCVGGTNGNYNSLSIDTTINYSGPQQSFILAIRYRYAVWPNGNITCSWSNCSVEWAASAYLGNIYGNGFAFGTSGSNFIAAIVNSSNGIRFRAVSTNYGIEITSSGVKVRIGGTWYTLGVSGGQATLS